MKKIRDGRSDFSDVCRVIPLSLVLPLENNVYFKEVMTAHFVILVVQRNQIDIYQGRNSRSAL
jgi:hypothetical protein